MTTALDTPRFGSVGRQPLIDYLTKDYAGFRQGMLDQIPTLLPQWTDRSEADFGVVLIELVAYVADILSYYQDRVANESFLATATQRRSVMELLRLIGYRLDPGLSASALVHLSIQGDEQVDVSNEQLPFQLKASGRPGRPDVVFEIQRPFTLHPLNDSIALGSVPALDVGATAIVLAADDHRLSVGDEIYFEQDDAAASARASALRRSPRLTVTAISQLPNGNHQIHWSPPLTEAMQPPHTTLKGNNVVATHGRTIEEREVLGGSIPGQRFALSQPSVTHLLRASDEGRRRSSPQLEVYVNDELWSEVDDFSNSRPGDKHYLTTIDENDLLTVTFGNANRGNAIPSAQSVRTRYRVGVGAVGNVPAGTLTTAVTVLPGIRAVTNPFPATGGTERESTDEAKISGPGSVIAQERAVTLADYRLLAQGFPGVAKAHARIGLRGGYKVVQVFAAPTGVPDETPPPLPSPELKAALKQHLEGHMPVNRMAGVDVLDPVYVPVDVTVDVHLRPQGNRVQIIARVEEILADLLAVARQSFGQPIRAGAVFTALFALDGVAFVQLRKLARRDGPTQGDECLLADVPIAENEIAVAGDVKVNVVGGR